QLHGHPIRARDHVVVGQDVAVGRDDEPRARALLDLRAAPLREEVLEPRRQLLALRARDVLRLDKHDRRPDVVRHGDERVADVGGGLGGRDLERCPRRLGGGHEVRRAPSTDLSRRALSDASSFSTHSLEFFSTSYTIVSSRLRRSISSRRRLSSAAWASASLTILSMSLSPSPEDASIRIFCSLPVALSLAVTCRMPFASMSNVTSICGTPRAAGGIPVSWNFPIVRLSSAIWRSPCNTWISTVVWLSSAVEKISDFLVGIVVLRCMRTVVTPPRVSMPSDSGVTSSNRTSFTSPASTPPWIAAPIATTSSGFTPLWGSLPKKLLTISWTLGIRVWRPSRITSSISEGLSPASFRACSIGGMVRLTRSSTSCSSFARVSVMFRCLGPDWSAVMNGRLISVCITVDSSIFAFSAASLSRCRAIGSL